MRQPHAPGAPTTSFRFLIGGGTAGLAIAVYAAWITDVADVNAILRAVT